VLWLLLSHADWHIAGYCQLQRWWNGRGPTSALRYHGLKNMAMIPFPFQTSPTTINV
jgi:hypothetical protein